MVSESVHNRRLVQIEKPVNRSIGSFLDPDITIMQFSDFAPVIFYVLGVLSLHFSFRI